MLLFGSNVTSTFALLLYANQCMQQPVKAFRLIFMACSLQNVLFLHSFCIVKILLRQITDAAVKQLRLALIACSIHSFFAVFLLWKTWKMCALAGLKKEFFSNFHRISADFQQLLFAKTDGRNEKKFNHRRSASRKMCWNKPLLIFSKYFIMREIRFLLGPLLFAEHNWINQVGGASHNSWWWWNF